MWDFFEKARQVVRVRPAQPMARPTAMGVTTNAVPMATGGDREQGRCGARAVGAVGTAGEQPVFAAHGDVAQRSFGDVVVDVEEVIRGVTLQCLPMTQRVSDGQADQALGSTLGRSASSQ